ncbi:MAG: class I SAM-dependent methyltransferase [Armatimonadota bacterium]
MFHRTPWWLLEPFDRTVRGLLYDAEAIVKPYVRPGDRVADIGCGTGFFSVALSRLVGPCGEVVLADVQRAMVDRAVARCERDPRAQARLIPVVTDGADLDVAGPLDFALLSWSLHEMPDVPAQWRSLARLLRPGREVLVIEPLWHVSRRHFELLVAEAQALGFRRRDVGGVCCSRAALLRAPERAPHAGDS